MTPTPVPAGLAEHLPGPELCALLAAVDSARVSTVDTVPLLRAWRRLRSYVDAHELATMAELGRRDPGLPLGCLRRPDGPDPDAGAEIAAALTLTEGTAYREHAFADHLVHRLPAVHAALAAGLIDRSRAGVFADYTDTLTDSQIARICDLLLPKAPGLTTGQLRARLLRMVQAVDPDAARRRYRKALHERRVICYLDDAGTATISAGGLDPAQAQAACERLDHLARDVRAAGHPDTLSQLRADLFSALLDGTVHEMTREEIIAAMLARAAEQADGTVADEHADAPGAAAQTVGAGTGDQADGPDEEEPDDGVGGAPGTDPRGPAPTDASGDGNDRAIDPEPNGDDPDPDPDPADPGPVDPGPTSPEHEHSEPGSPESGNPEPDAPDSSSSHRSATRRCEHARPGVEIRVRLSTLLGLDEHPGEIPGLGPVLPGPARATVARQWRGEWRFAVTDEAGYLILAGATRHRPGPAPPVAQSHRGIVELQVPASLLTGLAAVAAPEWRDLIADLNSRYRRRGDLLVALGDHPCARFPHEALRRHLQVRDRTCVYPGCRRPAYRCQQDHTIDHRFGGPTLDDNLGPLCIHHHSRKTTGRWRLDQPEPGRFRWRSPFGAIYRTRGEPVLPTMPDPDPEPSEAESCCVPQDGRSAATDAVEEQPLFPPRTVRPASTSRVSKGAVSKGTTSKGAASKGAAAERPAPGAPAVEIPPPVSPLWMWSRIPAGQAAPGSSTDDPAPF